MTDIAANDQGCIEKDVFGFLWSDAVPFPVLRCIRFIPIKAGTSIERLFAYRHPISISLPYTCRQLRRGGAGNLLTSGGLRSAKFLRRYGSGDSGSCGIADCFRIANGESLTIRNLAGLPGTLNEQRRG